MKETNFICQRKYEEGLGLSVPPPPCLLGFLKVWLQASPWIRAQITGCITGYRIKVIAEGVSDEGSNLLPDYYIK